MNTAENTRLSANDVNNQLIDDFSELFNVIDTIKQVVDGALELYSNILNFLASPFYVLAAAFGLSGVVSSLSSFVALFNDPGGLGVAISNLFNLSDKTRLALANNTMSASDQDRYLIQSATGLLLMLQDTAIQPVVNDNVNSQLSTIMTGNINASNALIRRLLLVQTAGISSYLNCVIYNDIILFLNKFLAAIDAEMLLVNSDLVYQSLLTMRISVYTDLTMRSHSSARLITYQPINILPAIVLSYELYQSPLRDQEIIDRNNIKNPNFIDQSVLVLNE